MVLLPREATVKAEPCAPERVALEVGSTQQPAKPSRTTRDAGFCQFAAYSLWPVPHPGCDNRLGRKGKFGRHIAVAIPLAEFDGLKRRLLAHGAVRIDPEHPTPFARFFFRDADGYVCEVVAVERQAEA